MPTIAVDAMGGDLAPEAVVRGVADVSLSTDIECVLVGDEHRLQEILERERYRPEYIAIVNAPETLGLDDDPHEVVRRKRRASLPTALRLVAEGRADAAVSAGNTTAAVLACERHFALIPGVRKPALASVYPRQVEYAGQDHLALLLDAGATIRCEAMDLVQFGIMGSAYARRISKVAAPRVGLLNTGREESQGDEMLMEAHRRLRKTPAIHFVGNVEGHELVAGRADVIVCEGLIGNVLLKLIEGLAQVAGDLAASAAQQNWRWKLGLVMLAGGVGQLRELTDYAAYGGAPILGFEHMFIKAHGRSNARAIGNAVKVAAKAVRDGVPGAIRGAVAEEA